MEVVSPYPAFAAHPVNILEIPPLSSISLNISRSLDSLTGVDFYWYMRYHAIEYRLRGLII